jgi:hypothetical protein
VCVQCILAIPVIKAAVVLLQDVQKRRIFMSRERLSYFSDKGAGVLELPARKLGVGIQMLVLHDACTKVYSWVCWLSCELEFPQHVCTSAAKCKLKTPEPVTGQKAGAVVPLTCKR